MSAKPLPMMVPSFMSAEITDEMKRKAEDMILTCRIKMMTNLAFFGTLIINLDTMDASAWRDKCPTIGTDSKYLYYNPAFVVECSEPELRFMFAHCVMHCIFDHFGRRGSRDLKLWDEAIDNVINLELKDQGEAVGKMINRPEINMCCDPQFANMESEMVYDLLYKLNPPQPQDDGGQDDSDQMDDCTSGKGNGKGRPNNKKPPNKGSGSYDSHFEPSSGEDDGDGGDGPVPLTAEERQLLRERWKHELINAAKRGGNIPASAQRMIENLTDPKMDWRQLLTMELLSMRKNDYSFYKPSKKTWSANGVILPGMPPEPKVEVAVSIDVSGSISDEMVREFLSEVMGIMQAFNDYEIHLWCFDTSIHNYKIITPENADEVESYEIFGGGGTSFEVNWEFMNEKEIEPSKLVMFTDGYPNGGWGDPDYVETLFIIKGSNDIVAPFGVTAYYD